MHFETGLSEAFVEKPVKPTGRRLRHYGVGRPFDVVRDFPKASVRPVKIMSGSVRYF
ncbi:MAG: hypothetical protein GX154_11600 [Clostridiales bacterium]|nr:hypothetical protein [Clostridiales bacterium]